MDWYVVIDYDGIFIFYFFLFKIVINLVGNSEIILILGSIFFENNCDCIFGILLRNIEVGKFYNIL